MKNDDINYVPVLSNTCRFVWGLNNKTQKEIIDVIKYNIFIYLAL